MDWSAWSRESVALMAGRTRELMAKHGLGDGDEYRWDLDAARFVSNHSTFRLVCVGTVVEDSFLWAWANDVIPVIATHGLERVREFGVENDLGLLVEQCAAGGLAQAKECLALAGRLLDADGIWIDETQVGHIVFLLFELADGSAS